jgi:SAM-dependent methyltransferase
VKDRDRETADEIRARLEHGSCDASSFRAALTEVAALDRDAWVDRALGLGPPPDDGPQLPRGCVPYLPCPVDALLRLVDGAAVSPADLFVDIGAGVGRAAAVVSLLSGASVLGLEVQPALVLAARELTSRMQLRRVSFIEGDAVELPAEAAAGTVFLLYCPFGGDRLARLLARLESLARTRTIRICCVDLPLPPCPWLQTAVAPTGDLAIYRSTRV